jgi:hypothetical protein
MHPNKFQKEFVSINSKGIAACVKLKISSQFKELYLDRLFQIGDLWVMRFVGNCKFKYFAAQMTTHDDA